MLRDHDQAGSGGDAKPCGCGGAPDAVTPHCATRCDETPRELIRYYNGRFLAARDLRDQQDYLLGRARFANRMFHGWGVICGLQVQPHPRPECADRWVVVTAGLALDCCGREIFVCDRVAQEVPGVLPSKASAESQDEEEAASGALANAAALITHLPPVKRGPYLVCLRYAVRPIEPGPVLLDDCEPGALAYNRLREEYVLEILPFDPKAHAGCWPWPPQAATGGGECPPCKDEPEQTDCFAPDCPCGDCVPLALLYYDARGQLVIDTAHQPRVRSTHTVLTRVAHINWRHGDWITQAELQKDLGGKFEICFTRPLKTDGLRPGTGVNFGTFDVTYTESQGDFETLPAERAPYVTSDGCRAVFEIERKRLSKLKDGMVRIKLHCNCVLDRHGNPIDGDFLNGILPSGDGVAGGAFESWFWIGDADDKKEAQS